MFLLKHGQKLEERRNMRKSLLVIICVSSILLVGFQVVGQYGRADAVEATVDIKPDTLNLNMRGQWITAYIGLPDGYNVSDIDPESVLLENKFGVVRSSLEGGTLVVKFEADGVDGVIAYLWTRLSHMGSYSSHIDLTIQGHLKDGTQFAGMDTITIMDPIKQ
jgi:hypothetical protein